MAALQIPVAFWRDSFACDLGNHHNGVIVSDKTNAKLFLGLQNGRILKLHFDYKDELVALEMVLLGHTNPIVKLLQNSLPNDQQTSIQALLSLDRKGELALWSIDDGRCLLYNGMAFDGEVKGACQTPNGKFIMIYGHSSFINIVKSNTLEVIQSVSLPMGVWLNQCVLLNIGGSSIKVFCFSLRGGSPIMTFEFNESSGHATSAINSVQVTGIFPAQTVRNCFCLANEIIFADLRGCCIGHIEGDGTFSCRMIPIDQHSPIIGIFPCGDDFMIILGNGHVMIYDTSGHKKKHNLDKKNFDFSSSAIITSMDASKCLAVTLNNNGTVTVFDEFATEGKSPLTCPLLDDINGSMCSSILYPDRIVQAYPDGSLHVKTLTDGFLSFAIDLHDHVTLPIRHESKISCLRIYNGNLIFTGDVNGVVSMANISTKNMNSGTNTAAAVTSSITSSTSGIVEDGGDVDYNGVGSEAGGGGVSNKTLNHHSSPIIELILLNDNQFLIIDQTGRVSICTQNPFAFKGFIGARNHPIRTVRWTSGDDDLKISFSFTDGRIQVWNLVSGLCEKECNENMIGLDDLLLPFKNHKELLTFGRSSLNMHLPPSTSLRQTSGEKNNSLNTILTWLPSSWSDPLQVAIFDIRKLLDVGKDLCSGNIDERTREQAKSIIYLILSLLFPWGVDKDLDADAHRLGFGRVRKDVSVGMIGANGNLAFVAPGKTAQKLWYQSSTMSATLYLTMISLFELSFDFGEHWDSLRMSFLNRLIETAVSESNVILKIPLPSFAFVSKYWHDLSEELRHGSRLLIVQTLARLDQETLLSISKYWTALLPVNERGEARRMNRAAIILGILAVHQPEILTAEVRKLVADSLMNLVVDEKRNLFRSAAIELIGKAFSVWEEHVPALSVFRLLLGWLSNMSQIDESGPIAQLVVPFESAATLDTLDAVRGTLLKLASAAADLIIPEWLGNDFNNARSTSEKWTTISLLSDLVRQRPSSIRSHVPLIAETACKLVESGSGLSGATRQRMMAIASPLVIDMLHSFPTVCYHRETYRLAAAADAKIVLCDLKGSSASRQLEGHTRPATCIDFDPEGRILLSYSAEEATLRWWQVPGLLGGLLSGTIKPFKTDIVQPELTEAALTCINGLEEGQIENIRFNWTEDKQVQILVNDQVVSIIPFIPN